MVEELANPLLVVASEEELPPQRRVWGTGGWLPPEEREALDWLTLARLLGWGVSVARRTDSVSSALVGAIRWVVVACDPDSLGEEWVAFLTACLADEPVLVATRAPAAPKPLARLTGVTLRPGQAAGSSLAWTGPGPERRWLCRKPLQAAALEVAAECTVWATLDGAPLVAARRAGRGTVATLGCHPSQARDADGCATALLRHLLIAGAAGPVAWLDLEDSLVLRMDDPGSCQSVYSRRWSYPKLGEADWAALAADLCGRQGRLSIGYVAGWVDDGAAARGSLEVAGRTPPRVPGRVHPSPLVKYRDHTGHRPGTLYDYEAEYRGIQGLRAAGVGDVELHGYTHLHPDRAAWAQAPDRYEEGAWYRELGRPAASTLAALPAAEHPLALASAALRHHFGVRPTTLICPGDQWTDAALERALDLGLDLVSSYYLALRDRDRFCWCTHVCAPYLDGPDGAWFTAGLPVVGYFHDREPALEGISWIGNWLNRWQACGARRLLDLRELAAALGRRLHCEEYGGNVRLRVAACGAPVLVRPLRVSLHQPGGDWPPQLTVLTEDGSWTAQVQQLGHGRARVLVPGP